MTIYKGYEIDTNTFPGMITVFFDGDEIAFESIEEAKEFIDSVSN